MRKPRTRDGHRKNHHVIIERPGADPRACARVERTKKLVDEILGSPQAATIDPTTTSLIVHIASGWLGERCGYGASWESFDARAFVTELPRLGYFHPSMLEQMRESLCFAIRWMATNALVPPAFAEDAVKELRASWPAESKMPSLDDIIASLNRTAN